MFKIGDAHWCAIPQEFIHPALYLLGWDFLVKLLDCKLVLRELALVVFFTCPLYLLLLVEEEEEDGKTVHPVLCSNLQWQ